VAFRVHNSRRSLYAKTGAISGANGIFAPLPFFRQPLKTFFRQNNGSFTAILHSPTLEIHKVFLRIVLFVLRQNFSLSARKKDFCEPALDYRRL